MSLILDTNICIALLRGGAAAQTISTLYPNELSTSDYRVSLVTVGELYSLASQWNWGSTRWDALDDFLHQTQIVDINDESLLMNYARLDHAAHLLGRGIGKNDLWIAATASILNLTLLTADGDFDCLKPSGLQVILLDPRTGFPIV